MVQCVMQYLYIAQYPGLEEVELVGLGPAERARQELIFHNRVYHTGRRLHLYFLQVYAWNRVRECQAALALHP